MDSNLGPVSGVYSGGERADILYAADLDDSDHETEDAVEESEQSEGGEQTNTGNKGATSESGNADSGYRIRPASELAQQTAEAAASVAERIGLSETPIRAEEAEARMRAESAVEEARFQIVLERFSAPPEVAEIGLQPEEEAETGDAVAGADDDAGAAVRDSAPARAFQDNLGAVRGGDASGEGYSSAA